MTLKSLKLAIKIILGITVIALLTYAFLPEKIPVDMAKVERTDLAITIEGEGKTRIHDIYTVSAPIDGKITRISSEPGDRVAAGRTVIANMFPANPAFLDKRLETQAKADVEGARAALALASAKVKQVKAQLAFEKSDLKRTQELYKKKSISKALVERAELRMDTLTAELETAVSNEKVMVSRLEAAKATLLQPTESAEKNLNEEGCHICIHSPVEGVVLNILHKSEGIVPVGTPLIEIGNPEDLEVELEMLSTNAVKVNIGDKAIIKRWGGGENIAARVKLVEPSGFTKISALGVEEQRVKVILSFVDKKEKWSSLGNAYRVEASIIIDEATNVLTVPISALFRENEKWSIFKVKDSIVELQSVEIGKRNDRFAEVISGVNEGDLIITHPGNSIEDGVKVIQR